MRFVNLVFVLLSAVVTTAETSSAPTKGRSLFDRLFLKQNPSGNWEYQVPYPFERLVQFLENAQDSEQKSLFGTNSLLIPIGRSLERRAGIPDMFRFPRIVVNINSEGVLPLRDRIYLGFNENIKLLQVLSYNDGDGRFEYQTVDRYDAETIPINHVFYVPRKTCTACHQNEAGIFSMAPWGETQANPTVSRELQSTLGPSYLGIPTKTALDVAYNFENSILRSNRFAASQEAWQKLCPDENCRRQIFKSLVRMQLKGENHPHLPFNKNLWQIRWKTIWPNGIAIPNPRIPNRFILPNTSHLEERLAIAAELEPLNRRTPLEVLQFSMDELERLFAGLVALLSQADFRKLELVGDQLDNFVDSMATFRDEYGSLFSERAFDREMMMAALSAIQENKAMIFTRPAWPKVQISPEFSELKVIEQQSRVRTFIRCASCHNNLTGFPTAFLSGDTATLESNLKNCAPRMFYRLSMWRLTPKERPVAPMPPPSALEMPTDEWINSREFKTIESFLLAELERQNLTPSELLKSKFSDLAICSGKEL